MHPNWSRSSTAISVKDGKSESCAFLSEFDFYPVDYNIVALDWLCFFKLHHRRNSGFAILHSTFSILHSLCLALFGFVFLCPADRYIAINSFRIILYADLRRRQIGFVFSNCTTGETPDLPFYILHSQFSIRFVWLCLALFFAASNYPNLHKSLLLLT